MSAPRSGSKYDAIPADYPRVSPSVKRFDITPGERVIVKMDAGEDGCGCCPCGFCGMPGGGIAPEERNSVPAPLADKGVTLEQWQRWQADFAENVDPRMKCTACECLCCMSIIGAIVYGIMASCGCWADEFQLAAREWQDRINKELNPPMFAKTQVILMEIQTSHVSRYAFRFPWLSIALTAREAEKLRKEPHYYYTTDCEQFCCCGNGGCGGEPICGCDMSEIVV